MTIPPNVQRVASQPCRICRHAEHVVVEGRLPHLLARGAGTDSKDPWLTLVTCNGCGVTDFFADPERIAKIDGATMVSASGASPDH
jgi:hypothetical protein